jgi:2-succinyl-5-enolpyruvyl-6-hydroxy-3-cyclohexene-1-carboxylate synthase
LLSTLIEVYCNRTSGIDGSTSTAIGAAVANVFITGDIGFYTIAMHYGTITFKKFKIILINNGGGIFLPGHKETPVFNTFFETSIV